MRERVAICIDVLVSRLSYNHSPFLKESSDENALETMHRYFSWGGRILDEDIARFRVYPDGVVVLTPLLCLMARAVGVNEVGSVVLLPNDEKDLPLCNAWMIHFMAGDLRALPDCVPQYDRYPLVCYVRGGRLDSRMRMIPVHRFSRCLDLIFGRKHPIDEKQ